MTPDADVPTTVVIGVVLPGQLRALARVGGPVQVRVDPPVCLRTIFDALEADYPTLAGTIRDRATGRRRPMIRLYVASRDVSDLDQDAALPADVARGDDPLRVVAAIAGG